MVPKKTVYEGVKSTLNQYTKVKDAVVTLNNGLKMPILGLGTYKIRGTEQIYNVVDNALKAGYRSFDTASVYGNEEAIGSALCSLLPKYGLKREDIFITSKLAPKDQGALKVTKAVEESLEHLCVDYIDLYLIHWPGVGNVTVDKEENRTLRLESWAGLVSLQEKGKLKAIGVSNYTHRHLTELLSFSSVLPSVNQVEFHPYFRQSDELLTLCANYNILLQAYCSFGGTGVRELFEDEKILEISKKLEVKPCQILLRWALQNGYAIIPKTVDGERMKENTKLDFVINEEDMEFINSISYRKKFAWDPENVF